MFHNHNNRAVSHSQATVLLIALTVLLAAMVLLLFRLPFLDLSGSPAVFQIERVQSFDESGRFTMDSRVTLVNTGDVPYDNRQLMAVFFRNGQEVDAPIPTMNGEEFISTHHTGVQTMGGSGCRGRTWEPRERVVIDFSDRTFRLFDQVRVDIVDKRTGQVISRHSRTA